MAKQPPANKKNYGYSPQAIGPEKASKPIALWVALGVLGVAAIIGIVVAATAGGGDSKAGENQDVEWSGTALPAMPQSATPIVQGDAAAGLKIPKLEGKTFDGKPISVEAGGGPQLIVFLAHWCPHCQAEVPRLVERRANGSLPESIRVVGISTGVDSRRDNFPPSEWLDREKWTDPVMADDKNGTAGEAFGLGGFPYMIAVDADGKVVKRSSGELTEVEMQEMIDAIAPIESTTATTAGSGEQPATTAGPTG